MSARLNSATSAGMPPAANAVPQHFAGCCDPGGVQARHRASASCAFATCMNRTTFGRLPCCCLDFAGCCDPGGVQAPLSTSLAIASCDVTKAETCTTQLVACCVQLMTRTARKAMLPGASSHMKPVSTPQHSLSQLDAFSWTTNVSSNAADSADSAPGRHLIHAPALWRSARA